MTYPTAGDIATGTPTTPVNTTNYNKFVSEINAIKQDLINGRGDGDDWPVGTPHTAGQSANLDNMLDILRHMIKEISGEDHYYSDPAGSLKVHTHAIGQGGAVPWSAIASNARFIEIHPAYPGVVQTTSLFGGAASGSNTCTITTAQNVTSNIVRNYYNIESSESSLQDYIIAVLITLPENFTAWATSNGIQIDYQTGSGSAINSKVNVYIYKSGTGTVVASSEGNASSAWSTITIDDSALGSWSAGNMMLVAIKGYTRNNYAARCGKIRLNYTS